MIVSGKMILKLNGVASVRIVEIKKSKVLVELRTLGAEPELIWVDQDDTVNVTLNVDTSEITATDEVTTSTWYQLHEK